MALQIEDIIEKDQEVLIGDYCIEIKPLSLYLEVLLKDDLQEIIGKDEKDYKKLLNVFWYLIRNKQMFMHNKANLFKMLNELESVNAIVAGRDIINVILLAYKNSRPIIKNKKVYDDLMRINKENGVTPCYGVYYDRLAKRYKYTIKQFGELTLRQVSNLLNVSGDMAYDDLTVEAALNNKKIKPRMKMNDDITEERDNELDQEAKEMFERLNKKYMENKKEGV